MDTFLNILPCFGALLLLIGGPIYLIYCHESRKEEDRQMAKKEGLTLKEYYDKKREEFLAKEAEKPLGDKIIEKSVGPLANIGAKLFLFLMLALLARSCT